MGYGVKPYRQFRLGVRTSAVADATNSRSITWFGAYRPQNSLRWSGPKVLEKQLWPGGQQKRVQQSKVATNHSPIISAQIGILN
jgi:hypothetical protein